AGGGGPSPGSHPEGVGAGAGPGRGDPLAVGQRPVLPRRLHLRPSGGDPGRSRTAGRARDRASHVRRGGDRFGTDRLSGRRLLDGDQGGEASARSSGGRAHRGSRGLTQRGATSHQVLIGPFPLTSTTPRRSQTKWSRTSS